MIPDVLMASLVMLPLGAAVAAFLWPAAGRRISLLVLGSLVPISVSLAALIWSGGTLMHSLGGWSAPLGIRWQADSLSVVLLVLVAVVGLLVTFHAQAYYHDGSAPSRGRDGRYFWPLWLFLFAGLNAMFLSGDLFNLYVTLEIKGMVAVALIALAGSAPAVRAALNYLLIGLTGSLLYLMGVALLYGGYGTVDIAQLQERVTGEPYSVVALGLMSGGLVMKAALFPMHFWLPPAHSSAPAPVSAVLSALVVKGGVYILLRLWFEVFAGVATPSAAQFMGVLGAVAVVWGSVQALMQDRLKLMVAYSTVAQLGYLFLVLPLALREDAADRAWVGCLVLLLAHATAKAAMFLAAGNIQQAAGHDRMDSLEGVAVSRPISVAALALAGLSLIGLPPTAGFVGKWLLLGTSLDQGMWGVVVVLLAGTFLAALYMMRMLSLTLKRGSGQIPSKPVAGAMEWSALTLALLALVLGLGGGPLTGFLVRGGGVS